MPKKKRTLKATQGASTRPAHKPRCHTHDEEMGFNALRMVWECPRQDCKMVAHPPEDIGGKRPVGFDGTFEAILHYDKDTAEDKVVIRKDKVFFDVTEHVGQAVKTDTGFMITLIFEDVTRFDGEGNPM